jgi:Silicon transporter
MERMNAQIDATTCEHDEEFYEATIAKSSESELSTSIQSDKDVVVAEQQCFMTSFVRTVKFFVSGVLLVFCTTLVTAAVFQKQTKATGYRDMNPIVVFIVLWVVMLFLALIEGGLNCMVGLVPVDKTLYADSHPRAYGCTKIVHKDGNMERFIVGRQYLDLMSIFTINFMACTIKGAAVLGLPKIVSNIFLDSSLAVILVTIVFGQLVGQINAADCMLDFVNNYVMVAASYLALIVEASGICHAVYFVQLVVESWAGKPSLRRGHSTCEKASFWIRVVLSFCLLAFALAATFKALFDGNTMMFDAVPPYVSLILFVVLVLIVGMLDALQIAFMVVVRSSAHKVDEFPVAKRNCDLVFKGKNLAAFLLGRQIFQTVIQFAIARIVTFDPRANENIFGVSDMLQKAFNAGVLGALIATILASLIWRVLANSFPMAFLSSPLCRPLVRLCLFAEGTGVCSIAWVFASVLRKLTGFNTDDHHLGQAKAAKLEQRDDVASTDHGSDSEGNRSQHDDSAA